MSEQLCVTTAIIGLLAVGGKALDSLYDLTTTSRDALLGKALQEVRQCRSAAHILYKTFSLLEAGQLPFPPRASWIGVDDLVATLTDTVLAISDLQAALEPLERAETMSIRAALCHEHASTLASLSARIRWHNLSMTMMMTILKCPGEADAQNSRLGLTRRITRLLSSNTDLAARLRSLRDLHGIKAARVTIPTHAPAAETAPRLPARTPPSSSSSSSDSSAPSSSSLPSASPSTPKTWSVLSAFKLADIPVLSMVPLPVTTLELREGTTFYAFDFAVRVSRDLVELIQSGQGNSKMLRAILAKPVQNGTHAGFMTLDERDNPANTRAASSDKEAKRGFKNPLRYRMRRKVK